MTQLFEVHAPAREGAPGIPGWEITLRSPGEPDRTYGFDEREGVTSAAEAVRLSFERQRDAARAQDGAEILISVREIRVVVSAEIEPN
jgi:hypothetical protein